MGRLLRLSSLIDMSFIVLIFFFLTIRVDVFYKSNYKTVAAISTDPDPEFAAEILMLNMDKLSQAERDVLNQVEQPIVTLQSALKCGSLSSANKEFIAVTRNLTNAHRGGAYFGNSGHPWMNEEGQSIVVVGMFFASYMLLICLLVVLAVALFQPAKAQAIGNRLMLNAAKPESTAAATVNELPGTDKSSHVISRSIRRLSMQAQPHSAPTNAATATPENNDQGEIMALRAGISCTLILLDLYVAAISMPLHLLRFDDCLQHQGPIGWKTMNSIFEVLFYMTVTFFVAAILESPKMEKGQGAPTAQLVMSLCLICGLPFGIMTLTGSGPGLLIAFAGLLVKNGAECCALPCVLGLTMDGDQSQSANITTAPLLNTTA